MNSFYVYVMQEVKASATAPIKIGVSNDITRRLMTAQTNNPRKLEIRLKLGPLGGAEAYDLENHLHKSIQSYRLRGEWFSGKALSLILKQDGPPDQKWPFRR
jgi:hypothetical protein